VIVSYPSVQDWRNLYDPNRSRDVSSSRQLYADMRHSHQRSILKLLDLIHAEAAGRAVLSELSSAPHEVLIFPFDFQPSQNWRKKSADEPIVVARTQANTVQNAINAMREGLPVCGKTRTGHAVCIASPGGGGRAEIFFAASLATGSDSADEVLLHELVHASRHMRGLIHHFPMTGGYENQEEFLAMVVENIYRSEKGRAPISYGGPPMDKPDAFLDSDISPSPRTVIAGLRSNQPTLFAALSKVETRFNPVREVELGNQAYIASIERE
jgi:hypothetical protein